jgi:hypothetical protein
MMVPLFTRGARGGGQILTREGVEISTPALFPVASLITGGTPRGGNRCLITGGLPDEDFARFPIRGGRLPWPLMRTASRRCGRWSLMDGEYKRRVGKDQLAEQRAGYRWVGEDEHFEYRPGFPDPGRADQGGAS